MGLAIDVLVTSPLTKGGARVASPCEDYAAIKKHRKYDASFEGANYYFCVMVFETLVRLTIKMCQLFTFAAQHLGHECSSFCSRGWARVSCCLQRTVAHMSADRIDDQVGAPELRVNLSWFLEEPWTLPFSSWRKEEEERWRRK